MNDRVIIYDYEVYPYDTLQGALIIDGNKVTPFQTWDEEEIRKFFNENKEALWVGHNNFSYDDNVLETIVNGGSAYETNYRIVKKNEKIYCKLKFYSFDLIKVSSSPYSLKLTELLVGKNIHTTDVPFDIPRHLTDEEKKLTEGYNMDDLLQTYYNYKLMRYAIDFRIEMSQEFGIDLMRGLRVSDSTFGAMILKAKQNPALQYIKPQIINYPNLKISDDGLRDYFLREKFREGYGYTEFIGNVNFELSLGGGHWADKKVSVPKLIYVDVSGYYNRIMLEYSLLPRSISEEGKALYRTMFNAQLVMKKTNPKKRGHYKKVLLAPFGSMNNKYTDFFDPLQFPVVTLTGQLFIIDLLEKLIKYVRVIQINTDGIMIEPIDWNNEPLIMSIIEEWETRTKFTCKKEHLYNLWQKDVNNYICQEEDGTLIFKGEIVKNYDVSDKAYSQCDLFGCEEPPIIAQGIVNYLIYGKDVEEFVNENKHNLKLFQYPCMKKSASYVTYDTYNVKTMEHTTERLQGVDRAFACCSREMYGEIKKHTEKNGKHSISKMPCVPDNCLIYDYELNDEAYEKLKDQIDWNFYVKRIYERISEFIRME